MVEEVNPMREWFWDLGMAYVEVGHCGVLGVLVAILRFVLEAL